MNKKLLKISLLTLGAFLSPSVKADSCCEPTVNSCGSSASCQGDISGSFLFVRPNGQVGMPEIESFWRRRANNGPCGEGAECGIGGAIQVVGFGGRSTRGSKLGSFFGFENSNSLAIGYTNPQTASNGIGFDVNPINFGIDYTTVDLLGSYSSTITLDPQQNFAGVAFEWRQYLGWWNEGCESRWWFDILVPFEHVQNKMNLSETTPITTGAAVAGSAANMIQAFAGQAVYTNITGVNGGNAVSMEYGLIPLSSSCATNNDDCSNSCSTVCPTSCVETCSGNLRTSRNGVADVTIRLGYDALCTECCYVNGYVGVLAPTGNRPTGRVMFEPIIGHNRHVGFVFGSLMSYDILSDCDRALSWEVNFDSLYLFKGKETRSFDLDDHGPWSRYLLVYASAADAAASKVSPGINFFTQDVNVTPRFWTSINSALVYNQRCGFAAEAGWNLWVKQAEKVSLKNAFPTGISLVGLTQNNAQYSEEGFVNQTNVLNTIGNNNAVGTCTVDEVTSICANTSLIPVTSALATLSAEDLDLCSGTNPAAMTNMVYGAIGYNFDWCAPMFIGVGGSYEFTPINTALNRWNVWGKFIVSF